MTISCSKCGKEFTSLIIDPSLAFKELETRSAIHTKERHRDIFEAVAEAVQIASINLARVLVASECLVIPEEETWIHTTLEEAQDTVMMALGFDPEEEEEEDEDNEEEDGVLIVDPIAPEESDNVVDPLT